MDENTKKAPMVTGSTKGLYIRSIIMSIFKRVEDSFEFELLNIYVLQEDCLTFFVKKKRYFPGLWVFCAGKDFCLATKIILPDVLSEQAEVRRLC
jgi:hypothetical protein